MNCLLTKTECMSILVRLENKGINIDDYVKKLMFSKEVPLEVLQFMSKNQGIEITNFYEMLRKNHNKKKSPLYTNILKEETSPKDIILTLSCLLTQIILYSNKLSNPELFLRDARIEEVTRVLHKYFDTGKIEDCITLLKLIRSDILVLEYINGRRELSE